MSMLSGDRVYTQNRLWDAIEWLSSYSHSVSSNNQRTLGRAFQTAAPVVGDNTTFYPQTFSEIKHSKLQVEISRRWERQTGLVAFAKA